MPVPPKIVRRLILAPLVVAIELVLLILSPVFALLALLASPFTGGLRPLRLLAIAIACVGCHLGATLAVFGLWIASGFGWKIKSEAMVRAHYAVMRWFVGGIYRTATRMANVNVEFEESQATHDLLDGSDKPVVLLSRHAGEGETLFVIHELLTRHDRGPRVVLHERFKLDSLIDALGERLPNRFVDPRGGDTEVEIAAMAKAIDDTGAIVIFPEGRNFSEETRRRGIERLEEGGWHRQAEQAKQMTNVSAPRPGGTLAAIEAAPHCDVVIMGHDGFPTGLKEVWRLLPEQQTIHVRLWHESASAVPEDREDQIDWLFAWWRTLDSWVDERQAAPQ
jgi:1-acyl-sn-glycerol-3-phosphate acyltransferase